MSRRKKTEKYVHHNAEVSVMTSMKGKHRNICLCYQCKLFKPDGPDNCFIANAVYMNCVKYNLVTPVLECPRYEE